MKVRQLQTIDLKIPTNHPIALSARDARRQIQFQESYNAGTTDWDGPDRPGFYFDGSQPVETSGGGYELHDMAMALHQDIRSQERKSKRYRTFRDRTEIRSRLFAAQMEGMLEAYLHWVMEDNLRWNAVPELPKPGVDQGSYRVRVVDVFGGCARFNC